MKLRGLRAGLKVVVVFHGTKSVALKLAFAYAWLCPTGIVTIHDLMNLLARKDWPLKMEISLGFKTLSLHLWLPEAFVSHGPAASRPYMNGRNVLFHDRLQRVC